MCEKIHPMDILRMQAQQLQLEPVLAYIRVHYTDKEQVPILVWIIQDVKDDDYIARIYDAIAELGPEVYHNSNSRYSLFDGPFYIAYHHDRLKVVEKICDTIFSWSPFVFGQVLWVEVACRLRSMQIVDSYIRKRGLDFIRDPEVIAIILQEDYVELMDFCLKLKLDKGMRLSDGRSLYEAAISDEMRALLDERLIPPSLGDR